MGLRSKRLPFFGHGEFGMLSRATRDCDKRFVQEWLSDQAESARWSHVLSSPTLAEQEPVVE